MQLNSQDDITYRLMVEAAPNSLILIDRAGKIRYVNAFTESLFQYQKDELVGKKLALLLPDRYKQHHIGFIQSYFRNPAIRQMGKGRDLFAVKKDGQEFPVEIGLNPIETKNGMLVLAVIIDITERKKNELLLEQRTRELEIINSELQQFTSIASHDLQEPLNTIISWTDLLGQHDNLDIHPEKVHQFIIDAATRMKSLIQGLLEFNRLGHDLKLKKVNCHELVSSVLEDLHSSIVNSKATIHFNGLPKLWAYELELRLLFQNLISNALKFKRPDVLPDISISARLVDNFWQFSIKDNGIGIEERHQEKIFTIFQRLHSKNKYDGSGIGLAHCKKIVDLHQGSIHLESKPGEGSNFIFSIKLKPENIGMSEN